MRLLHLRLRNLNSLQGDWELDFRNGPLSHSGLFAITGDTGAGKTTLLDAITLSLYGKTAREHETEVMSHGTKECMAELVFEGVDGIYRAHWTQALKGKKSKNKTTDHRLDIWKDGEWAVFDSGIKRLQGTKHKIGLLDKKVGLDYDQFCKTVLLPQGAFSKFLKSDKNERAAILERLTNSYIYSTLGMLAYDRHRDEKQALALLEERLKENRLPTAEELEELKEKQAALKEQERNIDEKVRRLRENKAVLEAIQGLETKQSDLKSAQSETEKAWEAVQPDIALLHLHQAAMPHQSALVVLANLSAEQQELGNEVLALEEKTTKAQTASEAAKSNLDTGKNRVLALEKKLKLSEAEWEKMRTLDKEIAFQKEKTEAANRQWEEAKKEFEQTKSQAETKQNQVEKLKNDLSSMETWFEKNPQAASLQTDLRLLESRREAMRERLMKEKDAAEMVQKLQSDLEEKTQEQQHFQRGFERQNKELENLRARLTALLERLGLGTELPEVQAALEAQAEQERARERSLDTLLAASLNYRQHLDQLVEHHEQKEQAQGEDFAIGMQIYNNLEPLEFLEKERDIRARIYEQQRAFANYDRDRANLQEGEPCPLCGAEHHPYAAHLPKGFVDTAKADFEKANSAFETLFAEQQQLLQRQRELTEKLQKQWRKDLDEAVDITSEKILSALVEQEHKLAELLPAVSNAEEISLTEKNIVLLKEKSTSEYGRLVKIKAELVRFGHEVNGLERAVLLAGKDAQTIENQILVTRKEIRAKQDEVQENQAAFAKEAEGVGKLLARYGETFHVNTFREVLERLSKTQDIFIEFDAKKSAISTELSGLLGEQKSLAQQLASQEIREKELQGKWQTEREVFLKKTQERQAQFGTTDPEAARVQLEAELMEAKERFEAHQSAAEKLKEQLTALQSRLKEKQEQALSFRKKEESETSKLQTALIRSPFDSVDSVQAAFLSDEKVRSIKAQELALSDRRKELKTQLDSTEKQLAEERKKEVAFPVLEDCQKALQESEAGQTKILQEIGYHNSRAEQFAQLQANHKGLMGKIEAQRKEEQRWGLLSNIIGSAKGDSFRIFAQSLTLEQLVKLANKHLQNLNRRYLIRCKNDDQLGLEIIDTYQADHVRSVNSLSGGETFLACLALALGLSDLAGVRAQIHNLFIDEGFGALDETALDVVVSALENLQSSDVTIGIVSHVRGLKERIQTQVQVHKKGNGRSEVFLEV